MSVLRPTTWTIASGGADAVDAEPVDACVDAVAGHELQPQEQRGGRYPAVRFVDLLCQGMLVVVRTAA
ncbi:MAG: hypothetical protein ACYCWW_15930 [Deltaproteobacteria bacterium]